MTELLFYENSYIKSFKGVVLSCENVTKGFAVTLDKTAFFYEGGGQKADSGYIGGAFVTDVQLVDGKILHYVNKALEVGEEYNCELDWDKRFSRMQNHSGEHIVSGVVHSLFGYDNIGFHMEEDYVTVDFNGELTRQELDEIEDAANKAIYSNIDIDCFFPSDEALAGLEYRSKLELTDNIRLVKIGDVDLCACCAPHVSKTGEIGLIKILDFMRHRGGVRIIMKSGFKALQDYRVKYSTVYEASVLLSAKQTEVPLAVERLQRENNELNRSFSDFKLSISRADTDKLLLMGNVSYFISEIYDADMMRSLVNYGMEKSELCIVFSGEESKGFSYIAGSNSVDLMEFIKALNTSLNGKGGGRGTMVQGRINATREDIVSYLEQIARG